MHFGSVEYALLLARLPGGLALERSEAPRRRKALVGLSLAVNLGILGYFKYRGFFLDNLYALGLAEPGGYAALLLPPGISF